MSRRTEMRYRPLKRASRRQSVLERAQTLVKGKVSRQGLSEKVGDLADKAAEGAEGLHQALTEGGTLHEEVGS